MKRIIAATLAALLSLSMVAATPTYSAKETPSPYVKVMLAEDSWGSGTYLGNGYFLTAEHVVDGANGGMYVKFDNGTKVEVETVLENHIYDFAVVRTKNALVNAPAVSLNCRIAEVGTHVRMHGSPGAEGGNADFLITEGIIAGKNRPFSLWGDVLPVDMTISWGMSGGGVTNDNGQLIGIGVGIMLFRQFAMPIAFVVPSYYICNHINYAGLDL